MLYHVSSERERERESFIRNMVLYHVTSEHTALLVLNSVRGRCCYIVTAVSIFWRCLCVCVCVCVCVRARPLCGIIRVDMYLLVKSLSLPLPLSLSLPL